MHLIRLYLTRLVLIFKDLIKLDLNEMFSLNKELVDNKERVQQAMRKKTSGVNYANDE